MSDPEADVGHGTSQVTVDLEDIRAIIGEAYNLITQGESPVARRRPSAMKIYKTAYKMLDKPCPLDDSRAE